MNNRYQYEVGDELAYGCMIYIVVDTAIKWRTCDSFQYQMICECEEEKYAVMICEALNKGGINA